VTLNDQVFNKLTTYLLNTRTAAVIQRSLQYSTDCLQTEVTADTIWTQSIFQLLPHVHSPKPHWLYAIWRTLVTNRAPARLAQAVTDCSVHSPKPTPYSPSARYQPFLQRNRRLAHSTTELTDLPIDFHSNQFELSKLNTDISLCSPIGLLTL